MKKRFALPGLLTASFLIHPVLIHAAMAQSPEEAGHALVREHCASCHAIGKSGASPNTSAPAFRTLGNSFDLDDLERRLRRGLEPGHADMPALKLNADEAHAIVAYLRTIQK